MSDKINSKIKMYKCNLCNKLFRENYRLEVHIRMHTGERPFKCTSCVKSFTSSELFANHNRRHEILADITKQFQCQSCGKMFVNKHGLKNHLQIHAAFKPYKCDQCGKAFRGIGHLRTHKLTHSERRSFDCCKCSKQFITYDTLRVHMEIHETVPPRYKCAHCPKAYRQRSALCGHVKLKHSRRVPDFSCVFCERTFPQRQSLYAHLLSHTGERPSKCELCKKEFTSTSNKNVHIKRVHTRERAYRCELCHFSFVSKADLDRHLVSHKKQVAGLSQHAVEKTGNSSWDIPSFVCLFCGKVYARKHEICAHMCCHTGERPFSCESCGMGFTSSVSKTSHVRSVHRRERKYRCDVCGAGFQNERRQQRHIENHNVRANYVHQCDVCKKFFKGKDVVRVHRRNIHGHIVNKRN